VLPGVYCLKGTRLTWHGMLMAACLWAEGVVSHRSASLLWGLEGVNDRLIEITTTTRRESVPGVLVHRVGAEEDLRIMRYQGLCVTDPTRTLINLAGVVDDITLQAALDSALRQRRTYPKLLLRCAWTKQTLRAARAPPFYAHSWSNEPQVAGRRIRRSRSRPRSS
jgi:predicted transcriptional regulator of viral defense system